MARGLVRSTRAALFACAAIALCCAAPAEAHWRQLASPPTAKPLTAHQALRQAESAFRRRQGAGTRDLSPLLARLARALPTLHGAEQRRAARLLARPTDGGADPQQNGWSVPEAPRSPLCSSHYCVHWVESSADAPDLTDSNGNGIPDWVETVDATAENVYSVENVQLGWRPPKSDGTLGGGN